MTWTVVWLPGTEAELTELWLAAADREPISLAANQIDRMLSRNPAEMGEERAEGRRILVVPPLAVTFRVLPADVKVQVVNVREFRAKPA